MKKSPREENAEQPAQGELEPETGSFGAWLRRQREVRDITLREIADDSKISLRYLQALEEERFDILPAPVFVKGFLRHYARFVGLDPEEVVNFYLVARQDAQEDEASVEPKSRRTVAAGWRWGAVFAGCLAALLAIVMLIWYFGDDRRSGEPTSEVAPRTTTPVSTTAPPAAPVPAAPQLGLDEEDAPAAPAEPAQSTPLLVLLQFDGECWVEASVDQRRQISEIRVQGEALRLEAQREVSLTLGVPGVVRIEVNGHPYAFEQRPGDVVRDLRIDLATATRLAGEPG